MPKFRDSKQVNWSRRSAQDATERRERSNEC